MPENLTRRSFIAAAAAPALLRAQGPNEKIQVGWIGVGVRGYGLIGSLMEVAADTAHVKAVCDTFAGNVALGSSSSTGVLPLAAYPASSTRWI